MKNSDYLLVCGDPNEADEIQTLKEEEAAKKRCCSPTNIHRMFRIGLLIIILTLVLGVSLPLIQSRATKLRKSLSNGKRLKAVLKNCVLLLSADSKQPLNEMEVRLNVPGIIFFLIN